VAGVTIAELWRGFDSSSQLLTRVELNLES
jgi:hypothetical protein